MNENNKDLPALVAVLCERIGNLNERLDRMDGYYEKAAEKEDVRDAEKEKRIASLERWRSGVVAVISLCVGAFGYVFALLTK